MIDEARLAIGRRITERRMARNQSQDELAEQMQIKQSSVSVAELKGLSTLDGIKRWAQALECNPIWLAYGTGAPEQRES